MLFESTNTICYVIRNLNAKIQNVLKMRKNTILLKFFFFFLQAATVPSRSRSRSGATSTTFLVRTPASTGSCTFPELLGASAEHDR